MTSSITIWLMDLFHESSAVEKVPAATTSVGVDTSRALRSIPDDSRIAQQAASLGALELKGYLRATRG